MTSSKIIGSKEIEGVFQVLLDMEPLTLYDCDLLSEM